MSALQKPIAFYPKTFLVGKFTERWIYLFIGFTVTLFNLVAIFGPKILLHDEPGLYNMVINNRFPSWMIKYNIADPFIEWPFWHILAYSPPLARGLYVLILVFPLSCCFYYVYRSKFGFNKITAFTAAVLPNILPIQWQIPAGINMSYVMWGLLFSVLSLIIGFQYLEKNTPRNWIRAAAAILLYLTAIQTTEQALFILPPLLFAFWGYRKFSRKHLFIILVFTLVGISRYLMIIMNPRMPIQKMPINVIIERIGIYFQWALPIPGIPPIYACVFFLGILFVGFFLYFKYPNEPSEFYSIFSHFPSKVRQILVYGFYLCWMASTILPPIFLSIYFPPRYGYTSMFGAQAIFIFSIFLILKKCFPNKRRIGIAFFIAVILISGISRTIFLKNYYAHGNRLSATITGELNRIQLPLNSQIVIVNLREFYGGWIRGSGYFEYTLKRNDLTGLAGKINSSEYYNFDNHFDPSLRRWITRYQMTGLTLKKPLFLFYFDTKRLKLNQMEFALQWRGEKMDAPWTILKVDKKTGKIRPFTSGVGMEEYLSTIEKLEESGIHQSDILWGGPPTKEEQKRLGI
jgi:hypothetical protein